LKAADFKNFQCSDPWAKGIREAGNSLVNLLKRAERNGDKK